MHTNYDYDEVRRWLLAYPVPAFAEGVALGSAVRELARLGDEFADAARRAVDHWQRAEVRATIEAVMTVTHAH